MLMDVAAGGRLVYVYECAGLCLCPVMCRRGVRPRASGASVCPTVSRAVLGAPDGRLGGRVRVRDVMKKSP